MYLFVQKIHYKMIISVDEVRVLNKPDKRGHYCGFVTFDSSINAEAFIQALNHQVAFEGGQPLNVKYQRSWIIVFIK